MQQNKILKDFKKLCRFYESGRVFVAFDTETSSISPSTGRIIEIGAVKFTKDGVIGKWNSLFNPQVSLTPFITNLTHITNQMVMASPVIQEKLSDFLDFIEGSILIAHNAQFDLNFLNFECDNCHLPETRNHTIDTLQYSRWAYPDFEKHKLEFLAEKLNLNAGQSHRAQDDAETCMQLFERIILDTAGKK